MRIAHIATVYSAPVGVLETKLVGLDAIPDFEITAITGRRATTMSLPSPRVRQLTVPMERSIRPIKDLVAILRLQRILKAGQFDIVHTHMAKAGVIGAVAARLAGVPLILHTYHGLPFYPGQSWGHYHIYRLLEKFACRMRHHVLSQNQRDIEACVDLMGSRDRVSFEGNGVDPEAVQTEAEEGRHAVRGCFPEGSLRLVLISRLEPVKRVKDFVQACHLLEDNGVDFSAVIAGSGPLEAPLRREIEMRGLQSRIAMVGWIKEAKALLAETDIAVLVSEKEGIPRSIMEAMALGRPVVATDVPGTQELVRQGQTGILVPLGDPASVAKAIVRLSRDPALRNRLGSGGRDRIDRHYDDLRIVDFLAGFYREHLTRAMDIH